MDYFFNNERPIYIQIVEQLKINIISGHFKPNSKLPSVRDLAINMHVNPNTIQKALTELEDIGLIYTERTNGKFVTTDVHIIEKVKLEFVKEKVSSYFGDMNKLGLNKEEAIKYLEEHGGK